MLKTNIFLNNMGKIKIKLTENHIKLIQNFKFEKIDDYKFGVDYVNPYGGSFLMEDLALILGYYDKYTEGTEFDIDGRKYGYEIEREMINLHNDIVDNIFYIFSILQNFINIGLKTGVYTCNERDLIWKFEEK